MSPPGLAEYFRQHNQRAVLLAIGCLVGSVASWIVIYGIVLWMELMVLTTIRGVDAPSTLSVRNHFLIVAAVLFSVTWLVKKWERQHEKFHLGRALLSLLSIPVRLTSGVWQNFFAQVHPTVSELDSLWRVLETLRVEKKIAQTNLPVLLTSDSNPSRITYLLAIGGLIDTDNYGGVYYHHLRNQEAERLVRRWSRSLLLED
ncbi:MAG: hypothetical protein ABIT76_14855 [Chthoniobacterales bacterium]